MRVLAMGEEIREMRRQEGVSRAQRRDLEASIEAWEGVAAERDAAR